MVEAIGHGINYELSRVPQPLAEDLEYRLAKAALKKYETRRTPSGLLRSAWNYVEYTLNTQHVRPAEKEEHFRTGQLLTSMVMAHPKSHQDTLLGALTLSTYMPLFSKRASEIEVNSQDCEDVYRSLGQAMNYLRPLDVEEPPQWRMTEIGILALSARSRQPKLLMYPTSPREETSGVQALNHDSYFFDNKGKIPIQQKLLPTQKIYDDCIKILTVEPMLDRALRKNGDTERTILSEKVNYLLSLIVAEASDASLTRDETSFLNTMTEAVVAHYFAANEVGESYVAA